MSKKLKDNIFTFGIILVVLAIGIAVGTYAYYQTTVSATVGGTVLAWQCTANNQTSSFTISLGSLYPGSAVTKTIDLKSTIDAHYVITFGSFQNMGSGSTHPNLNIYKDSAHATVINSSSTIEGDLTGGAANPVTVNLYVYWPYGTTSEAYNTSAPSVTVTVTCTQQ